jgi:AcrR family transcriptional regulator
LSLFVSDGYAQVSIRNIAAKVEYSPGAIYSYFKSKDEIFFALAEEGFRLLGATQLPQTPSDDPLANVRNAAWRFYEFSKAQPQYFALVFLDRRVPRIGREYERFAFLSDLKSRLRAQMQQCIDRGLFPPTVDADVALRLLWAPILGIAALRLSERVPPEDADNLVLDAIDTTIAGLRAGAPSRARPSPPDTRITA